MRHNVWGNSWSRFVSTTLSCVNRRVPPLSLIRSGLLLPLRVWLRRQGEAVRKVQVPNTVRLAIAKQQHADTRSEMEVQARRAAKLDKKAHITIAGLQSRDAKLQKQLVEVANQVGFWADGFGVGFCVGVGKVLSPAG